MTLMVGVTIELENGAMMRIPMMSILFMPGLSSILVGIVSTPTITTINIVPLRYNFHYRRKMCLGGEQCVFQVYFPIVTKYGLGDNFQQRKKMKKSHP
jgi:hypothetical protein